MNNGKHSNRWEFYFGMIVSIPRPGMNTPTLISSSCGSGISASTSSSSLSTKGKVIGELGGSDGSQGHCKTMARRERIWDGEWGESKKSEIRTLGGSEGQGPAKLSDVVHSSFTMVGCWGLDKQGTLWPLSSSFSGEPQMGLLSASNHPTPSWEIIRFYIISYYEIIINLFKPKGNVKTADQTLAEYQKTKGLAFISFLQIFAANIGFHGG